MYLPARNIVLENKFNKELRKLLNDDSKSKPITSVPSKYKFLKNILKSIYQILPNFFKKYISNYLNNKRKE